MEVDYSDTPDEAVHSSLTVRIRLEWTGVSRFEIPMGHEDLLSIGFGKEEDQLVTILETWPGVFGKVISDRFEAILVKVDPGIQDETVWLRFH